MYNRVSYFGYLAMPYLNEIATLCALKQQQQQQQNPGFLNGTF